jgi:hypothetical protein
LDPSDGKISDSFDADAGEEVHKAEKEVNSQQCEESAFYQETREAHCRGEPRERMSFDRVPPKGEGNECVLFMDVVLLGCGDGEHNGQSDLMRDDAQKGGKF